MATYFCLTSKIKGDNTFKNIKVLNIIQLGYNKQSSYIQMYQPLNCSDPLAVLGLNRSVALYENAMIFIAKWKDRRDFVSKEKTRGLLIF